MIECYQVLNKEYQFAVANDYKGSHDDYVRHTYSQYGITCIRNGIEPMNWYQWLQTQTRQVY